MVWAAGAAELPPFVCGDLRGLSGAVAVSAKDQIFGFWAGAGLFSEGGEFRDTEFSLSASPFAWDALISKGEW